MWFCITSLTTLSVSFFPGQRSLGHPARTPAISASSPSPWSRATSPWSWTNRQLKGWVAEIPCDSTAYLYCCCVINHTCSFKMLFSVSEDLQKYNVYAGGTTVWLLFEGAISLLLSNSRAVGYIKCTLRHRGFQSDSLSLHFLPHTLRLSRKATKKPEQLQFPCCCVSIPTTLASDHRLSIHKWGIP